MYTNTSTPTRTLPQQALDVLTGIEEETGRPILLVNTRLVGSRRRAEILIPDAWRRAEQAVGETISQEIKDNAVVLIMGATEAGGGFHYMDQFPNEAFIEGTDFNTTPRYFPSGEYVRINDDAPEPLSIGTWHNYCEVRENLVCVGTTYSTNWDANMVAALDWAKIVGDPVRMVADPAFAETVNERRRARDEAAFGSYMMTNRNSALTQARQRLDQTERYLTDYTNAMAEQMATARRVSLEIAGIEARLAGEDDEAAWRQKWNAIINHARVTEVRLLNGQLAITTEDLFMTHPRSGERRWLGRFDITINPANGGVRLHNLDNAKGGRDHPHVPQQSPCWGNAASMVSTLMSQGELYALLDLCIMFLETFNLNDDWGAYAAYWFDVPDETPTRIGGQVEQPVEPVEPDADLVYAIEEEYA